MNTFRPTHRLSSWQTLLAHQNKMKHVALKNLMDEGRFDEFHLENETMLIDYSKQSVQSETMKLLIELAEEANLQQGIRDLFGGEFINATEHRQVLHMALRSPKGSILGDLPQECIDSVHEVLDLMRSYVHALHAGQILGSTGRPITTLVNIGIGGSDLGPRMVVDALKDEQVPHIDVHFVANVDPTDLHDVLQTVHPEETVFIIASKSFTTAETMANANSARRWLIEHLGEEAVPHHFIALSTNDAAMDAFGIASDRRFAFWDWVGGRFSVSSAIGLSVACAIGWDNFTQFLAGMHRMDRHFFEADFHENMPVIMALLGIWNTNFNNYKSLAILPYSQRLARFADFLQQLEMESNGKYVGRDGQPVHIETCPALWGQAGTNGQHAFYQLIHQGTQIIPCDFIAVANTTHDQVQHHMLLANCLAQSRALLIGREAEELRDAGVQESLIPHKTFQGDRPSTTILLRALNPFTLGQLIALYEHKVFVQGWIWGIYSFDQWGVELGKVLAKEVLPILSGEQPLQDAQHMDASTSGLMKKIQAWTS